MNVKQSTTHILLNLKIEEKHDIELASGIIDRTIQVQEIIRNTIISIKKHTRNEIFSKNDSNLSLTVLNDLYEKTTEVIQKKDAMTNNDISQKKEALQKIIDKLSTIICGFGTQNIEDLINIVYGKEFKATSKNGNPIIQEKGKLILKYVQPIGYKIINWKQINSSDNNEILCINKLTEDIIKIEESNTFECFDIDKNNSSFFKKIHGICVAIQNEKQKKTLIVNGIIEDLDMYCLTSPYVESRKIEIQRLITTCAIHEKQIINRILDSMTLKDILIYGNEDIQKKMIAVFTEVNYVKKTKVDIIIKKFIEMDTYSQRNMLINLLMCREDDEIQYLCYIIYDLLTANEIDSNTSNENSSIYDSLPWKIKDYFKDVVKCTIKYTNNMMQKYDVHKITLEQKIYLMKADDNVKERAITKLKEINGKPEDQSLKAKQYLEGLIKIPFGVCREEPILKHIREINTSFLRTLFCVDYFFTEIAIKKKEKYTIVEICDNIKKIETHIKENVLYILEKNMEKLHNRQITSIMQTLNAFNKQHKLARLSVTNKNKTECIEKTISQLKTNADSHYSVLIEIFDKSNDEYVYSLCQTMTEINKIKTKIQCLEKNIHQVENVIDESIYSHSYAKTQIMKIISQWINGEQNGYCFGFEGSPGIGKTSLAKKGLSKCLLDENGEARPFSFIALGGSSNGSTLEGHGYTYVNSSWGKIVDILMETKCMNPIIYVDELDKVSKTEYGKEIISIFTHIIDSTQNDSFQDKYFNGINIDLSKALFIFSYNDPEQIDRILLDRIHRIKFENLSLYDKMEIVKKFILPELNKKMGFENTVNLNDSMIEYIITSYTNEPGVRKLKEVLFDLYGEINLELLKKRDDTPIEIPIEITRTKLEQKYLTKYRPIQSIKIHAKPKIGIINGLWANSLNQGGIIQIQTLFFPSSVFLDLQLTGLQGDVMKESMNVSKTLAWNLTNNAVKKKLLKHFDETKCQGLHIHCPEGAISKDGPSAGAAITTAIYSLFNEIQIKNDIAITGEISLSGEITAIGGLDIKISDGIKAGVKTFLYPKANGIDFLEWKKKNKNEEIENVEFYEVSNINEVFDYAFV